MLICILTKNVITSCSVTMMLCLHLEVKPIMKLTTVIYLSCALVFFQAEDSIRDIGVTGVQTCALPIYLLRDPEERRGQESPEDGGVGDEPAPARGGRQEEQECPNVHGRPGCLEHAQHRRDAPGDRGRYYGRQREERSQQDPLSTSQAREVARRQSGTDERDRDRRRAPEPLVGEVSPFVKREEKLGQGYDRDGKESVPSGQPGRHRMRTREIGR